MTESAMTEVRQKSPWVRGCELFVGLPRSVYSHIRSSAAPKEYKVGEIVYRAGDPVNEVLLLMHGRAKVTQLDCDGNEVIVRLIAPSEILGGLCLRKGDRYASTAQALEACRVLAWDTATFEAGAERYPALARNALRIVTRRLQELENRFCEISTEKVSARLARTLIRLLDQIGHRANGLPEINVSQRALGQMIASDVWTVNRVLSDWEQEGFVSLRRNTIVIRNYDGLLGVHNGC